MPLGRSRGGVGAILISLFCRQEQVFRYLFRWRTRRWGQSTISRISEVSEPKGA